MNHSPRLSIARLANVLILIFVAACGEASAAEAPIALAPVGVTINTNTPPPTPRVSPTVRPPTQPPTRTLVPTARPANTLAPIGRPPVRPAVQAVAPTNTFTAAPQTARNGTIREIEVESDVLSKLNANASEGSALLGQKITSGGTVRTLDRGKARIDLNEGTVVRVAPKTLFTVTDLNQDTLNPFTRLQLAFGKVFIILSGGRMEVETPVGAASVRGSFMSVEFNAALRQLTINCLETAFNCDLSYQGAVFNLLTLQKITVPAFPPRIQQMDGVDIKEWLINVPNSPTVIPPTMTNPAPAAPPPAPPAPTATNTPVPNIVVNTLTDELNNNGNCSLREAIKAANTNLPVDACIPKGGSDTITFSVNGTILMMGTTADRGDDAGIKGDYDITESLTVIGNGAANTIISANNVDRVFQIFAGTVSLSEMTISNGNPGSSVPGGGVFVVGGAAALSNVTVSSSTGKEGGGVFVGFGSSMTISGSTIKSNTGTTDGGGGIFVDTGGTLTVSGGTIGGTGTGNIATNEGGGIYTFGTATISNVLIEDNQANGGGGGGILTAGGGTTTIQNTTIKKNKASATGGGIHVAAGGTVSISKSAIDQNTLTSTGIGGGVYNENIFTAEKTSITGNTASVSTSNGGGLHNNAGTSTLKNVTVSGNSTSGNGGGIQMSGGAVVFNNVTVVSNTATSGGGIYLDVGTLTIANSILSANTGTNADCSKGTSATVTDNNHNLVEAATTCGFSASANNVLGSSANLAALAGTTPAYHALNTGSPAINAGFIATHTGTPCESTDALGTTRPQGTACDIGAYEKP